MVWCLYNCAIRGRKNVRRLTLGIACAALGIAVSAIPTHATGSPSGGTHKVATWERHDTAVYVVSTLNLCTDSQGRSLYMRVNPTHFDVFSDQNRDDLYFIKLRNRLNRTVGILSYQMGSLKPQAISFSMVRLGIPRANLSILMAFRSDPKQLLESFSSTVPS